MKPLQFVFVFLLCVSPLGAVSREFPEHNFALDVPENWTEVTPRPPMATLVLQSADARQRLVAFVVKIAEKERAIAAADARAGMKAGMGPGFRFDAEEQVTLGKVPFVTFAAHGPDGGTMTCYTTAAGERLYILHAAAMGPGDEVRAVLQSFRFLSAVEQLPLNKPAPSSAFRAGQIVGRIWAYTTIPSIIGLIVWVIYRAKAKRRVQSNRSVEPPPR